MPEPLPQSEPQPTPEPPVPPPAVATPAKPKPRRQTVQVMHHLQFAFVALTIALYIITFVVQAFRIPSGSMEDTLLVGDYLLVDKTRFGPGSKSNPLLPYRPIRRGEIVVFRYPVDPEQHFVKRVIGLPGDRVQLWRGSVFINGKLLVEPYAVFRERGHDEFRDDFPRGNWFNENVTVAWAKQLLSVVHDHVLTVPAGNFFVLGDNRDQSLDSRYWGFVPRANIIGRPMLIYFSIQQQDPDDDPVASSAPPNGTLFTLRARVVNLLGDLRWQRIMRLAP